MTLCCSGHDGASQRDSPSGALPAHQLLQSATASDSRAPPSGACSPGLACSLTTQVDLNCSSFARFRKSTGTALGSDAANPAVTNRADPPKDGLSVPAYWYNQGCKVLVRAHLLLDLALVLLLTLKRSIKPRSQIYSSLDVDVVFLF